VQRPAPRRSSAVAVLTHSLDCCSPSAPGPDGCARAAACPLCLSYTDHVKKHFTWTLNKLHLWNQTDYNRVVYMDADNIALSRLSSLFDCGHFCAVYMNPVNFHTGLLVIKPSATEFAGMLAALHDPNINSYDGADQGFLTAYFKYTRMINSPLFDEVACANKGGCEDPLNRLPVGYNLNAMWYYEKGHWGLYRQGGTRWENFNPPGLTLAFCVPSFIKPWFWYSHMLMDTNWDLWHAKRGLLKDESAAEMKLPLYILPAVLLLFFAHSLAGMLVKQHGRSVGAQLGALVRMRGAPTVIGVLAVYYSLKISFAVIPATIPPKEGWELFILYQATALAICITLYKACFEVHVSFVQLAKDVIPTVLLQLFNAITSYMRWYPVATVHIGRVGMLAMLFVVFVMLQVRIFVGFAEQHKVRPLGQR